ncbi:ABC transporter ATP-binding protein [Bacillus aquiflavi]|uniref:ABC transporter ATP-binding protein n=1 Tax=Bacillus aquiflavi TaxID=2672567 RepID=A0A6B3VVF7_9BACI|nr:ABC transporter ATP-binding protein [Bacillus aquiflavi]MBA4537994.1 ABC transporter ATP-binding protein [Bacillus aquiflavi]NEY82250.1 ABC transporter ATP-binding protein [Bacillus aquiflavi]UAC49859.1 ABC transporter ATP-binding protein [Bacillus aquiflavi]
MTLYLHNVTYGIIDNSGNKKNIINKLNLQIDKGTFVSLIGKSGTGKSTIFKLIAGLINAEEGEICVNGHPASLGCVGYMPQRDLLLPWRTVLENLMLVREIQKDSLVTKEKAREWLERVGLLEYENALPSELSGGMRQRVAFLRTVLTGKEVLLLDEPFGALDALTKREMHSWLLSFWQQLNKTIFFITHDLEEAVLLSDKIILLHPNDQAEEFKVELPRPRNAQMIHTVEMIKYRQNLEKRISNE